MRSTGFTLALLLLSLTGQRGAGASTLTEGALREAARQFGDALLARDSSGLRPILPARGKVRVQLVRLGPEQGSFGTGQVEAVLRDCLRQVTVHEFAVERLQLAAEGQLALVDGRAGLTDRAGRAASVALHLTFAPEESRWVLREIREADR